MSRPASRIPLLALLVLVGTCSDSTSPPVPTSLTINTSTTTLEALGATTQLSASVLDKKGKSMTGVPITWSSSNDGIATVSSNGMVTAVSTGSATVSASAEAAYGSVSISVTQVPSTLQKVQGDSQEGTVGEALSTDPTVKVMDARSNAIPGLSVAFAASGDGAVSSSSVSSSSTGESSVSWTLGTDASADQKLTATAGSLTAEFSATSSPGPAASVTAGGGEDQTGEALQPLTETMAALVADEYGNPVPSVEVTWAAGENSGSLSPTAANTNSDGTAQATWTLGPLVGAQSATATVEGFTAVTFSAMAGAPTIGAITVTPDSPILVAGGTLQLGAEATTTDGVALMGLTFTWSSSNPAVATVSETGSVSALGPGTATLTASYGESSGTADLVVVAVGQQTGVRVEVPSPAITGQTVMAQLIVNNAGVGSAVGAVAVTVEWDPNVLSMGAWSDFTGLYRWTGVSWTNDGKVRLVVSVPTGLNGEVTLLNIPFVVDGATGTGSDITLTVDRVISALTFLEIGAQLPAFSARLEVS